MTRRLSNHVYEIQLTPRSPTLVVHVDHLKKFEGPLPVKNWLASRNGARQPSPAPVGSGPGVVPEDEAPGDEFAEDKR